VSKKRHSEILHVPSGEWFSVSVPWFKNGWKALG